VGLSKSKSIVEAHDENILDGKGATFSYTLPNAELGGKLQ
jgi:signal transduction histidine kinase